MEMGFSLQEFVRIYPRQVNANINCVRFICKYMIYIHHNITQHSQNWYSSISNWYKRVCLRNSIYEFGSDPLAHLVYRASRVNDAENSQYRGWVSKPRYFTSVLLSTLRSCWWVSIIAIMQRSLLLWSFEHSGPAHFWMRLCHRVVPRVPYIYKINLVYFIRFYSLYKLVSYARNTQWNWR
jgi:hypothetical protein